jgi:MFS family permease
MMMGMFIDQIGGNLIYPFFALYVTAKFGVGLTQVGILLGAMTAGGIAGGLIGGWLADKIERKIIILFGLLVSGLFSVTIIFIHRFELLIGVGLLVGLLGSMSGPAYNAMMADIIPEEKRVSAFGVSRVVFNLTVAIGPLIGGYIADYSYNWLFIGDAITSAATFLIVLKMLPESKPSIALESTEREQGNGGGYMRILKDKNYIFLLICLMLMFAVMMQMLSTLSVYMRDVHSFPNKYYGYILSLNATMVVLMQFWVSKKMEKLPPLVAISIGAVFATIGYTMFGFFNSIWMFALAMAILTIGEMIIDPLSQALAAKFAPAEMRGRYMAALHFSLSISNLVTPYLAGLVIDNYEPRWIWYTCGIVGSMAILGFTSLYLHTRNIKKTSAAPS